MERGQNGRDDLFGFGGFGRQGSLISGFFGGRDPFDDPFFTQPFGSRMGGPSMFGPSLFGPMGGPFRDMRNDGFLKQAPARSNVRRPIITEIDGEEGENVGRTNDQSNHESYVQEPDDGNDGMQEGQIQQRRDFNRSNGGQSQARMQEGQIQQRRDFNRANGGQPQARMQEGQIQQRRDFNRTNGGQPQARTFTYQSSSVTYGGINGAYYTSSKTRRAGSDGITVEESKEADTTTKEATHRVSRGIHDKGHSLTRKLNSDGKVDTTQILHNLNADELAGFEESWKGNAGHHLPGSDRNAGTSNNDNYGNHGANGRGRQSAWGRALPGTEQARDPRHRNGRPKSRVIPIS